MPNLDPCLQSTLGTLSDEIRERLLKYLDVSDGGFGSKIQSINDQIKAFQDKVAGLTSKINDLAGMIDILDAIPGGGACGPLQGMIDQMKGDKSSCTESLAQYPSTKLTEMQTKLGDLNLAQTFSSALKLDTKAI